MGGGWSVRPKGRAWDSCHAAGRVMAIGGGTGCRLRDCDKFTTGEKESAVFGKKFIYTGLG